MKKLTDDLKNHSFEKVYLLYGDEAYLKRFYVNRFLKEIAPDDDMNQKVVKEDELSASALRDFTDTMPFFAERRLLVLTDTDLFKNSSEGFDTWLESIPDTCTVVFSETNVDKRSRLYKIVEKTGHVVVLNHPEEKPFSDWVLKKINGANLKITKENFDYLLSLLDRNMESAELELDKLISYLLGEEEITRNAIDAMITVHLENRIFDLMEQVAVGNRQKALDYYYDLLALREPAMRILFLIGRQFRQMAAASALYEQRMSKEEIAKALKLRNSFIVGKLLDQSRRFTVPEMKACVEQCVSLEEAVKTGNLNETLAVELFILERTGKRVEKNNRL